MNSAKCTSVGAPEQIDVLASSILLLHLIIESIPAHIDELEVVLNFSTNPPCTIIKISETGLK